MGEGSSRKVWGRHGFDLVLKISYHKNGFRKQDFEFNAVRNCIVPDSVLIKWRNNPDLPVARYCRWFVGAHV